MPRVLPSPAAPMTSPSRTSGRQSPIGFSRSRKAMNMVRKPESQRGPQFARRAKATAAGIRARARPRPCCAGADAPGMSTSGALAEAGVDLGGQPDRPDGGQHEHHEAVAQRPLRARHRASSPAIGADRVAPTTPASEVRAFALTSGRLAGARRGTAAARVTPYALDATSTPRAAGNNHVESVITAVARTQQRNPRSAIVAPMAQRRPWLKRSRNGPISGATIANGSIVRPRKRATWSRASPVGTWKKRVPASEIATAVSPAALKACSSISRARPGVAGALGVGRASRLPSGVPAGPTGHAGGAPGTGAQGSPDRPGPADSGRGPAATPVKHPAPGPVRAGGSPRPGTRVRTGSWGPSCTVPVRQAPGTRITTRPDIPHRYG